MRRLRAGSPYRPFPRRARPVWPHSPTKAHEPGKNETNHRDSGLRTSPGLPTSIREAHMPKNASGQAVSANVCIILAWGSQACQATWDPAPSNRCGPSGPLPRQVSLRLGEGLKASRRPFEPLALRRETPQAQPADRVRKARGPGSDLDRSTSAASRCASPQPRTAGCGPSFAPALPAPSWRGRIRGWRLTASQPTKPAGCAHRRPDDGITRIDADRWPWCTPAMPGTAGLDG